MSTLYKQIKEMYKKSPEKIFYYEGFQNFEFDKLSPKEFIVEYFSTGGKESLISQFIDEIDNMRSNHMVSAFFVGILLKEKLCPDLEIVSQHPENFQFSYIWFLVSLFHDMGYVQENDWTQKYVYEKRTEEDKRKNEMIRRKLGSMGRMKQCNDFGVLFMSKHCFGDAYSTAGRECREGIEGIKFNNGILVKKSLYEKETIFKYLEFCKMYHDIKHYDHGIVGGFWLYDSWYRNYCKKYALQQNIEGIIDFDNFTYRGLHFSKEQHYIFAYLADCIISHNIWPATESTNEMYKKCGLEELTLEKFRKIHFEDNPILYILALVDTIEPVKIYDGLNLTVDEIWRGVEIIFRPDKVNIKLLDKRMPFERIARKVIGLNKWIDVEYSIDSKSEEIEISILDHR